MISAPRGRARVEARSCLSDSSKKPRCERRFENCSDENGHDGARPHRAHDHHQIKRIDQNCGHGGACPRRAMITTRSTLPCLTSRQSARKPTASLPRRCHTRRGFAHFVRSNPGHPKGFRLGRASIISIRRNSSGRFSRERRLL